MAIQSDAKPTAIIPILTFLVIDSVTIGWSDKETPKNRIEELEKYPDKSVRWREFIATVPSARFSLENSLTIFMAP